MINSYAIYSDNNVDTAMVSSIYRHFKQKNPYCDFLLFSNNEYLFHNLVIASLSTFYMKFYTGIIIFTNVDDYIEYQPCLLNPAYIITSIEEMADKGYTRSSICDAILLNMNGDTIYEIRPNE
jgi:hypothetical protein